MRVAALPDSVLWRSARVCSSVLMSVWALASVGAGGLISWMSMLSFSSCCWLKYLEMNGCPLPIFQRCRSSQTAYPLIGQLLLSARCCSVQLGQQNRWSQKVWPALCSSWSRSADVEHFLHSLSCSPSKWFPLHCWHCGGQSGWTLSLYFQQCWHRMSLIFLVHLVQWHGVLKRRRGRRTRALTRSSSGSGIAKEMLAKDASGGGLTTLVCPVWSFHEDGHREEWVRGVEGLFHVGFGNGDESTVGQFLTLGGVGGGFQ